jgi:hypothetical protein
LNNFNTSKGKKGHFLGEREFARLFDGAIDIQETTIKY